MRRMLKYFTSRAMITNWIILVIMAAGTFGIFQLQRRVWPRLEISAVTIQVAWPGASAREIEEGLTVKMENRLKGIEGIENTYSTTGDGYVSFYLETSRKAQIDTVLDKVRNRMEQIPDYPEDARTPQISQEDSWNRVMLLFIYGPEELNTLQKIADGFRDDLLNTNQVSQINYWGLPEKEIVIELKPEKLSEYGLTLDSLGRMIRASSLNSSAGTLITDEENLMIRTYGQRTTIEELAAIPISLPGIQGMEGSTLPLGTLFNLEERWPEDEVYTQANGKPAVGFQIMYTNSEDVIAITEVVDSQMETARQKYGELVTFRPFIRDSDQIKERLGTLTQSGLLGLLLVLIILGLFLNLRLSFWVAFGIPFSFLGLLFIEWLLGITINEMSLFGMIMVLGILVDDGIIIGENIYSHWKEQGKTAAQAALDGTMEVIKPVIISIITTMVAFTPYFFIYGEMGQYTGQIGLVVVLCLAFSLLEAAVILPVHLAHSRALKNHHSKVSKMRAGMDRFQDFIIKGLYARFLKLALNHRGKVLAVLAASLLILGGALAGNHIKAMFFPEVETPYSYIEVSFPAGTSSQVIDRVRSELTEKSLALGEEERWAVPENDYPNAIMDVLSWGNSRRVFIYFILIPNGERPYKTGDFSAALAERVGQPPETESLKIGEDGAFGGYPISIRFVGSDSRALDQAAEMLKLELTRIKGVKDIQDNTPLGSKEIKLSLNRNGKARGLSLASLIGQIRQNWYGTEVLRISDGPRDIPLVIRMPREARTGLSALDRFPVQTPGGATVFLSDVAETDTGRGIQQIRRENGLRSIRVNAGLDFEANDLNVVMAEINDEIIPRILAEVEGVSRSAGGQAEAVNKMMSSMIFSMIMALLVMFTILLLLTGSFGQAMLILTLIPLGFVGAIFGHAIMGQALSFISFLGGLALAGIIVNDSVVFVDTYNRLTRKEKMDPQEAVLLTGVKRFRPIIMTTLTTSLGLAPLILQTSIGGQFLIPIAVSISFGLLFGTFLTLLVLPCILSLMADFTARKKKRKMEIHHLSEAAIIFENGKLEE